MKEQEIQIKTMLQVKFFNKTLDEIYDIIFDLNELLIPENSFDVGVTFEVADYWCSIKFREQELFNTENDKREYLGEEIDDYEDLKDCIKRILTERLSNNITLLSKINQCS